MKTYKIIANPALLVKSLLIALIIWLPIATLSFMLIGGGDGVVVSIVGLCFSAVFGYDIAQRLSRNNN
jgi:hypothetical protein